MKDDLRLVVDTLPGLVWTALSGGEIDFLNQGWCEYTGLTTGELSGGGWHATVHPEDLPRLREWWQSISASSAPGETEARLRRFDGAYRRFVLRVRPLVEVSGKVVKWCGISTDVEERRQSRDVLRSHEEDFRLIVDTIPSLIALMTPAGAVESVNRHALEYYGATLDELKQWALSDTVHPDDLPSVIDAWMRSVSSGEPYDIEHRIRRADGIYRWFHVRGLPLRDPEGRITRWCVQQTDVEELKAKERDLIRIINTIPTTAWSTRPDGYCDFLSDRWLDYAGLTYEQAVGWNWATAIHPDDAAGLQEHWLGCLATGTPVNTEARIRRFDGVYRWFLFLVKPFRDASGNIVKWYGTNVDIEDRKRAEEELRRSEAFLSEGQRLSRTGSFFWRVTSGEITWSEQIHRIFELDPHLPVTLELIAARVHPEDLPLLQNMVERAHAGRDFEYEHRLQLPDNRIKYLHLVGHGSKNKDGQWEYTGAVQDVTERRLSEETLTKVRSELAHVARVTSLGVLTASIAHEVNQPLSGIVTNASTCLRMLAGDPPNIDGARETARRTIRDGNRASEVIKRLRALFGKKEPTTELLDLNEVIREVITLSLSELQGNRVILRSELDDSLPHVIGDRVQLQQVLLNLLRNASDAMSSINNHPRQLIVKTQQDEQDCVRVVVQDTGVGIDPRDMESLFDAFFTTKNSGMGMGLSVSRSIIESHNGRIWAVPNDGPGTTLAFSIPRAPEGAPSSSRLGPIQASALMDTQNFKRNP